MYLVDFFKNLVKRNNIGLIIWIILNILLIVFLFGGFVSWQNALIGIAVYAVSLVIALSPIGEWILRLQTGCKKMTDPEVIGRLEPLFREVYAKSKEANPELPDDIKMFISDSEDPNAFATGRKTVCVTTGLLQYSDEHIKGVLAHEFGHLAHKDTDAILVVSVGNMIVNAIFVFTRVMANICMTIGEIITAAFSEGAGGIFASIMISISKVIADVVLVFLMRIWTQLGVWLCMHSSRKNEFEADRYALERGYGQPLSEVLESFGMAKGAKGLFATLASSHPDNAVRVEKLRSGNYV